MKSWKAVLLCYNNQKKDCNKFAYKFRHKIAGKTEKKEEIKLFK